MNKHYKKYGNFSSDGLEFVIKTPLTPRPWINYLTNKRYCAIISQCAGGYSFYNDCRSDRITRWLPENWHFDRPGRYLYIREKNQKSKIWSATYQPLRRKADFFRCRHGLGYTVIESRYSGIASRITFFVPQDDDCEIWLVQLTNRRKNQADLELYPYIEWLLGDYQLELRYRNIMNLYNRVWFDKTYQAIFAKKTAYWGDLDIKPFKGAAFFASSLKVADSFTRKNEFLGRYNTEESPETLLANRKNDKRLAISDKRICSGEDGIACFKHSLKLKPGEEKEFVIILGQTGNKKKIPKLLSKYRDLSCTKKELQRVTDIWRKRIVDNIWIKTPDKEFDLMMNIWVKYQLYICNFWSRSPSYYHEGSGGRGYRDSCQDAESICSLNPSFTRERILKLASLIRKDGTCAPGWADTTGPAKHRPNKDHQIWLTSTVASYIKETNDISILSKAIPYLKDKWIGGWQINLNWKKGAVFEGRGTLFEHLERNLEFCFKDTGPKGLPLIGHADWNDAIDSAGIKGKGESIWLAQGLVRSLRILANLARLIKKKKKEKELLDKAEVMARRINKFGWDGAWYRRGFTDKGEVYGSKVNKEGKIYLNSQSWAILSGTAKGERLKKLLSSVDRYLNGRYGLALFYPAYSHWQPQLGRISMFSEGTKENAAIFCHAVQFMTVAYCLAGYGERAYEAICKITPNKQKDFDLYETEPYVYAEYLVGPEHPYLYGQGAFTWITGTAGWSFMAATEWILGARRDFAGLRISPCLPSRWRRCFIRRPFRGSLYEITIENPQAKQRGVKELYVDGKRIAGDIVKPHRDGKLHKVKVIMG